MVKKKVGSKVSLREALDKLLSHSPASDHQAILAKLVEIVKPFGVPYTHLIAVIHLETGGTMSPSSRNKTSKATGLIHFLPSTAKRLGTSIEALSKMTVLSQLYWVKKYFHQVHLMKPITNTNSIAKFYLMVLRGVIVNESNEKKTLIDFFGNINSPGEGKKQASFLYDSNGFITIQSVQEYFSNKYTA